MREQGLALGAVLSGELLILQGADVDEHVEPCALDTGLEGQERNAQVARGGVVEAAQQGLCKCQGLVDELHHLHRGLGAALQALLDGGGAGSLLLVGRLGHTERGGDDVERLGVAVHNVEQAGLELVALLLDLGSMLGILGILLAALGQAADHRSQRGADGAIECGAGAAARRGSIGGNGIGKAGNGHIS